MKKLLLHLFFSFLVMLLGIVFVLFVEILFKPQNNTTYDFAIRQFFYIIVYIPGVFGFFSLRIIDAIKNQNKPNKKDKNEDYE